MTVKELIEWLQDFPEDMEVRATSSISDDGSAAQAYPVDLVSQVEARAWPNTEPTSFVFIEAY